MAQSTRTYLDGTGATKTALTGSNGTSDATGVTLFDVNGNPLGVALDGADASGVSIAPGGAGIRGWLSTIAGALAGTLKAQLQAGSAMIGAVSQSGGPWSTTDIAGGAVVPGAAGAKSLLAGLYYSGGAAPSPSAGQQVAAQSDSAGRLLVNTPLSTIVVTTIKPSVSVATYAARQSLGGLLIFPRRAADADRLDRRGRAAGRQWRQPRHRGHALSLRRSTGRQQHDRGSQHDRHRHGRRAQDHRGHSDRDRARRVGRQYAGLWLDAKQRPEICECRQCQYLGRFRPELGHGRRQYDRRHLPPENPVLLRGVMDRQIVYPLAIPYETDFLSAQRFAQEGLGLLALDILGGGPVACGLGCGATSPASLAVQIAPGRLYQTVPLDAMAYGTITGGSPAGGLPADVSHQVLKQGLLRDAVMLGCAAPSTANTSINYLIQAMFQEIDLNPSVLQFFNTQNPSTPLSGPGGSGITLPTQRVCQCLVQAKGGVAATTGSQVTPLPDAGWIGLYVVTVTFGQTAITAANISIAPGAPFLAQNLLQIIGSLGAPPGTTAIDTSAMPNQITASLSPPIAAYSPNFVFRIVPANNCTGAVVASINGLSNVSVVKPDGTPLQQNDVQANVAFEVIVKAGPILQMLAWPQPPIDTRAPVQTANFAALNGVHYPCSTAGGAFAATLPATPAYGDKIGFSDPTGSWKGNNLTINGGVNPIESSSSALICNLSNISFWLVFRAGSLGWVVE